MKFLDDIPENIKFQVMRQLDANRTWRENDTRRTVKDRLIDEYYELLEEIELDRNIAFLIASECGDILYLAIKYYEMGGEQDDDVDYAIQEALDICELTSLNPTHCILMKVLRNDFKYAPTIQNNGYKMTEATILSKQLYKSLIGGDAEFSQAWLEYGEQVTHEQPVKKQETR